jgi:YD repeat-containing protein
VRKVVLKNLALTLLPVHLMNDVTSSLAFRTYWTDDIDKMGENFGGEYENANSVFDFPCVQILQRRDGAQAWRLDCGSEPPLDRRIDLFEMVPTSSSFVAAHTDFPLAGHRPFTFVRKYRTNLDQTFAFGVAGMDSFDMWPVGDTKTFSWLQLELPGDDDIRFKRTVPGTSYNFSKFEAGEIQGNPFSHSKIAWSGPAWELTTRFGWTYQFPDCSARKTWVQCALIGLHDEAGAKFGITRGPKSDLTELRAPGGDTLRFETNAKHEILSAADSAGRTVGYDYDERGRLVHIADAENGDAFYEYDEANRLTTVRDGQKRALLINEFGHHGEVVSQTLADGRKFTYTLVGTSDGPDLLRITLPDGYEIEWQRTANGFVRSWPWRP